MKTHPSTVSAPVYSRSHYKAAGVLLAAMACSNGVFAQISVKADNTTSLNQAASWSSGGVPTSASTVQVSSLSASRTAALGANLSILGFEFTASNQFQISNTAGAALTVGSGGVTKNSSANLIFANAVTLGANQIWSITTGSLQVNGVFSDDGKTLNVSGAGTLDLRASNTFGANVTIDTTVSVNSAAATVEFGGLNTFNSLAVPSGRVKVATIGNFGVASNAGDGGTNSPITLGNTTNGVLEYTGSTAITNRTISRDARSASSGIDVTTAGQTLTISGALGSGTQTNALTNGWVFGGAGNLTLNGVISNATGVGSTGTSITKNDAGTLTLGANNSFTGGVTVSAGTLTISASDRVNDANKLTLAGGNFDVSTFSETLGALDLNGTGGTLTIGAGGTLIFANSASESWAGTLTVAGTFISGSSLRFGTSDAGLTSGQLGSISIAGFNNFALNTSGFLTASAIPEPSAFAALAGLGALGFSATRRRRRAG